MTQTRYSLISKGILLAALATGAGGAAGADEGANRPSNSYAYSFDQPVDKASSAWSRSRPHGVTEQELQALSSSNLSAFASKLNPPAFSTAAADPSWRQMHPNGATPLDLQALSSSSLSAFEAKANPPFFATAAADPSWRQTHPNGLTEQELVALSSNSISRWQNPDVPRTSALSHLARSSTAVKAGKFQ